MKKRFIPNIIYIYVLIWFAANLLFLDTFPFMHSDESWLSGLSRAMMHGGPGVTEPFFDLLPRFPHAIKILFHTMQMPFLLAFGYNLLAVRLISLIFGTATLYLVYKLALHISKSPVRALILAMLLSVDVQFIYASHFARQDIIIAFGTVAAAHVIIRNAERWRYRSDILLGVLIGLFIGIHPNSLMIALCAGCLYLYQIFMKQFKLSNLLILIATIAAFAGVFIGISYQLDSKFIAHYMQIGSNLGVDSTLAEKIRSLPGYFGRLFTRISGTYYTPPIQPQLIVFGISIIASAIFAFRGRKALRFLMPVLGITAGFVLIGRYSQPAVILFWPLMYLLVFDVTVSLTKKYQLIPALALGAAMLVCTVSSVVPYLNRDYRDYIDEIESAVPSDAKVLANLNAEYAFDHGALVDYRNLEHLEDNGLTFAEYIDNNDIDYIVYPQEMDFIYQKRPVWNIVYGNIYPYYDYMNAFLDQNCTRVHAFTSPYAMRITRHMDKQDWTVIIYAVERQGQQ